MKKWNVAIIGLGFVGKLHYDALRRLPNVHVRTIVVHKACGQILAGQPHCRQGSGYCFGHRRHHP